jgi:hypothetical protein
LSEVAHRPTAFLCGLALEVAAMPFPELRDNVVYLLHGVRFLCHRGGDVITFSELDSADPVDLLVIRRSGTLLALRSPAGRRDFQIAPFKISDLKEEADVAAALRALLAATVNSKPIPHAALWGTAPMSRERSPQS